MRIINIQGVGEIRIIKSRLARRIILKINSNGQPVVTLPKLTPYIIGKKFAIENAGWIQKHMGSQNIELIKDGSKIGSEHTVKFKPSRANTISSRVQNSVITISFPSDLLSSDAIVQAEAKKAAIRALRAEANNQLPALLKVIADEYGYKYNSVSIKKMHSRWGSCSSAGDIALSIWLMQLPDNLINYVLCHELSHLNNHNHQAKFWSEVESMVPDYKILRKQLKAYQPRLLIA